MEEKFKCPGSDCDKSYSHEVTLKAHYRDKPDQAPYEMDMCSQCGLSFNRSIGNHWRASNECSYPKLTELQKSITVGLLMGDESITNRSGPAILSISSMTTQDYLYYIDQEVFPVYGTGVRLKATPEEQAKNMRESGFRPDTGPEDVSAQYTWGTRASPEFDQYSEWYASGSKVFPESIKLSPETLTHWYVCDGSFYSTSTGRGYITISMNNERRNKIKIKNIFEERSLPIPTFDEYNGTDFTRFNARWDVDSSMELFEYMAGPLPGFQYKWPEGTVTGV